MAQSIYIQITKRGMATGPFTIYWDNFNNIVEQNVMASVLDAGYTVSVPDAAQYIVLENMDPCGQNSNYRDIIPLSPTPSVSITPSFSITPSISISATPSISITPSITVTATPSATPSISITATPSITITPTISLTASISVTPAISISATPSISISKTPSFSVSQTISITPSITITPTISVTRTPSISMSNTPSISVTPGVTLSPSISVSPTISVTPSITRTASVTPTISVSPTISLTPSVTRTASVSPTISLTPTITVSPTISLTPSITVSRTPSITPSRTPAIIQAFKYSNQEYNDGTVFLDGDLILNQNGSSFLPVGTTPGTFPVYNPTPGEVTYTGTTIYQDDSIYVQASGNPTAYPAPAYGTATRTLYVYDSALNTIINSTVDYNSNINVTFAAVGGRTYYALASTNFSWPTAATLSIGGMYVDGATGYYAFQYYLDTAVDGDFTISAGGGISADMYFNAGCGGGSEVTFGNASSSTVLKGQYGFGYTSTGISATYGFSSYTLQNAVYIDGLGYARANGDTFVIGVTTVTVNINTYCQPL